MTKTQPTFLNEILECEYLSSSDDCTRMCSMIGNFNRTMTIDTKSVKVCPIIKEVLDLTKTNKQSASFEDWWKWVISIYPQHFVEEFRCMCLTQCWSKYEHIWKPDLLIMKTLKD